MTNVWDEFEKQADGAGDAGKKAVFNRIDFKNSETQIRLLSDEGVKRFYHFVKVGSGPGKPVICCGDGCPVCATGSSPSPKWLFPALERSTLNVGIVQLPITVMRGVHRLRKLQFFGPDIKSYDILIIKDVTKDRGGTKTTYQVQGIPKQGTPKLPEDVKSRIKEELAAIDIEAVSKPYSPEQTMKYLGWTSIPVAPNQPQPPVPPQQRASVSAQPAAAQPQRKTGMDISKFLNEPVPDAEEVFNGLDLSGDTSGGSDDPLEI